MAKRKMHPSRQRVLEAFRKDPLASLSDLAREMGISASSVSLHLCALEKDGLITRPRKAQNWQRGNSRPRKKPRDADALQERIERVVANAKREGTCFSAEYVKLEKLGGCKCG